MDLETDYEINTPIKSLSEFQKKLTDNLNVKRKYVYRGHSDCGWKLVCSLARRLHLKENPTDKMINLPLLVTFQRMIIYQTTDVIPYMKSKGYDIQNGKVLSDFEMLANARHFDGATMFFDFSLNPLIALYFACVDCSNNDSAVIILDITDTKEVDRNNNLIYKAQIPTVLNIKNDPEQIEFPKQTEELFYWIPTPIISRIKDQESVFVFGKPMIFQNEYKTITIDKYYKDQIMQELDLLYGINHNKLFDDFYGTAQYYSANNLKFIEQYSIDNKIQDLIDLGQLNEAEALLKNKMKVSADSSVYRLSGDIQVQKKEYHEAIRNYQKSIEYDKNDFVTYFKLGIIYYGLNEFDNAFVCFSKVIELDGNNSAAFFNRGNIYSFRKEFARAINDYDNAIRIKHNHYVAFANKAYALDNLNKVDESIKCYLQALAFNDKDIETLKGLAHAYFNNNNIDNAIKYISQAILIEDNNPDNYFNRCLLYCREKKFHKALEDITKAIKLKSEDYELHLLRAKILSELSMLNQAFKDIDMSLAINPTFKGYFEKVLLLIKDNKKDKVADAINLALNAGNIIEDLLIQVIIELLNNDMLDEGYLLVTAVSEKDFNSEIKSIFLAFKSLIFGKKKMFNEAIKIHLEMLNYPNVDKPTIYFNIGSFYAEQERYFMALEYYNKAIDMNISNDSFLLSRARLNKVLNRIPDAINDLNKAKKINPSINFSIDQL